MGGEYRVMKPTIKMAEEGRRTKCECVVTNGIKSYAMSVSVPVSANLDVMKIDVDGIVKKLEEEVSAKAFPRSIGVSCDVDMRPVSAAFYLGSVKVSQEVTLSDISGKSTRSETSGKSARENISAESDMGPKSSQRAYIELAKPYARQFKRPDESRYWLLLVPDETPHCRDIHGKRTAIAGMCFIAEPNEVVSPRGEDTRRYLIDSPDPIALYPIGEDNRPVVGGEVTYVSPIELKAKYEEGQRSWAEGAEARRLESIRKAAERLQLEGKICIRGPQAKSYRSYGFRQVEDGRFAGTWEFKLPPHTEINGRGYGFATISVPAVRQSKSQEGVLCAYIDPDTTLTVQLPKRRADDGTYVEQKPHMIKADLVANAVREAQVRIADGDGRRKAAQRAAKRATRSREEPHREGLVPRVYDVSRNRR